MYLVNFAKKLFAGHSAAPASTDYQLSLKDIHTLREATLQTKDITQIILIMLDSMRKAPLREHCANSAEWQALHSKNKATYAKTQAETEALLPEYVMQATMLEGISRNIARSHVAPELKKLSFDVSDNFNRTCKQLERVWFAMDTLHSSAFDMPRMDEIRERIIPVSQAAAKLAPQLAEVIGHPFQPKDNSTGNAAPSVNMH